jgi:hypothetical protein
VTPQGYPSKPRHSPRPSKNLLTSRESNIDFWHGFSHGFETCALLLHVLCRYQAFFYNLNTGAPPRPEAGARDKADAGGRQGQCLVQRGVPPTSYACRHAAASHSLLFAEVPPALHP